MSCKEKQRRFNYFDLITGKLFPRCQSGFVPDFAYSVVNKYGKLYEPFLDKEWIRQTGEKPLWPDKKPYAVCITHDVDFVSKYNLPQNLRILRKSLTTVSPGGYRKNVSLALDSIANIFSALIRVGRRDPWSKIDQLVEIERTFGIRSTFFFAPEKVINRHFSDCTYKYTDKVIFGRHKINVAELISILKDMGFEIGLHSMWYSYNNTYEFKFQKNQIERVLHEPVKSVRQHFLHYDVKITPSIHESAGIKYDSTLGFNDNIGFRRGTCYPFYLWDIEQDRELDVLEIPLIIQDTAMLIRAKGMKIDKNFAIDYVEMIKEKVKEVGGVLTILWHPNLIGRKEFFETFVGILEILIRDNPWFATVKDVGNWWLGKVKINMLSFLKNL